MIPALLLASLLHGQLLSPYICSRPEDFYMTDDHDDWAPAIQRAVDYFQWTPSSAWSANKYGGCVELSFRSYHMDKPLVLDKSTDLRGASGGGWYSGSELECGPGVTPCIQVVAAWSHIHDLSVRGQPTYDPTPGTIGIELFQRADIHDVYVRKFNGPCIHIEGSTKLGHNTDGFHIGGLQIDNCGGDGILIEGNAANSGVVERTSIAECGGIGINDKSFLGNTLRDNQVATCKGGSYACAGGNQYCTIEGNYGESDTPCAIVNAPSTAVGGLACLTGTGYWFQAGTLQTRWIRLGPYQQLITVSNAVPTATTGHALGEIMIYAYPLPGSCDKWRLVKIPSTGKIQWKCAGRVDP